MYGRTGQPAFFLAGNRRFEKEVSFKSLAKRLLDITEVLNLRKTCNICKWEEKVQKNTGGRQKVKLRKLLSKDFIFYVETSFSLFSSQRRTCPVLKHNQVSEVFKGFKVHDVKLLRPKKLRFKMEI